MRLTTFVLGLSDGAHDARLDDVHELGLGADGVDLLARLHRHQPRAGLHVLEIRLRQPSEEHRARRASCHAPDCPLSFVAAFTIAQALGFFASAPFSPELGWGEAGRAGLPAPLPGEASPGFASLGVTRQNATPGSPPLPSSKR